MTDLNWPDDPKEPESDRERGEADVAAGRVTDHEEVKAEFADPDPDAAARAREAFFAKVAAAVRAVVEGELRAQYEALAFYARGASCGDGVAERPEHLGAPPPAGHPCAQGRQAP